MKKIERNFVFRREVYVRDASGNVLFVSKINYKPAGISYVQPSSEFVIYGSSRLGQYRKPSFSQGNIKKTALGQRIYEFSNHLGNVLVTLTDNKVPQTDGTYESVVLSASDYYPFGMAMSERTYSNEKYRYGFNGKEKDWDIAVGKTDFEARIYDELTGRWFSLDQYTKPHQSDYVFATDNPIIFIDPDGRDDFYFDKQARTWHIIPTGAPHRFITFINISDGEGGTIESIRPMTDSEVGAALYRNNELYVRAMQSAYTPENAGRLRYLRSEYFGLTSVNLSHKKARPIIYIIGGLIVLPIAAEVIGEAALAEFLFEETVEYGLESAGVPVPIFNDPTDIVEYAFKKGGRKTVTRLSSDGAAGVAGAGMAIMGSKKRWSNDEMRQLSRQYGDIEVAQVYVMGKGKNGKGGHYEIFVGGKSNVSIGGDLGSNRILINHTHPYGGARKASGMDQSILKGAGEDGSPQISSEIIHMDGGVIRFNHSIKNLGEFLKGTPDYKRPGPYNYDYDTDVGYDIDF